MVGSKCRDFKNREVSNVNAPNAANYHGSWVANKTAVQNGLKWCVAVGLQHLTMGQGALQQLQAKMHHGVVLNENGIKKRFSTMKT